MDVGRVPDRYRGGDWEHVRNPALRQFVDGLAARTEPVHGRPAGAPAVDWGLVGEGALLVGPVGTGKSTAAALIARAAAELRCRLSWRYVPDLLDDLSGDRNRRRDLVDRLGTVPLLILDDFAARDMTDHDVGLLDQIVERRYAAWRPMIVTTNLLPSDLAADARLARLRDRWRDRTARNVIPLVGDSGRRRG